MKKILLLSTFIFTIIYANGQHRHNTSLTRNDSLAICRSYFRMYGGCLDLNDSLAICMANFRLNGGCLDHNDSAAICKAYIKSDRAKLPPHHRPHDGLNLKELWANKKQLDIIQPGGQNGNTFTVTQVTRPPIAPVTFTFTNSRSQPSENPSLYSDTINQQTISNLLATYSAEPFVDGDADYFLFDAATMFNFIYSPNNTGQVLQDIVFELGRDPNNNNRLTLIISGYDHNLRLIPINGSVNNALENCYPCPQCTNQ